METTTKKRQQQQQQQTNPILCRWRTVSLQLENIFLLGVCATTTAQLNCLVNNTRAMPFSHFISLLFIRQWNDTSRQQYKQQQQQQTATNSTRKKWTVGTKMCAGEKKTSERNAIIHKKHPIRLQLLPPTLLFFAFCLVWFMLCLEQWHSNANGEKKVFVCVYVCKRKIRKKKRNEQE